MSGRDIPTRERAMVNRRSRGMCERCGAKGYEIHHRKRGNPRLHWVQNMVRLCRPCHEWATVRAWEAERTGWVLTGQVTAHNAARAYLPLLGRVWTRLSPDGRYSVGPVFLNDISEVPDRRDSAPTAGWAGLGQPVAPPVVAGQPQDCGLGEPRDGGHRLVDEVRTVDVPAEFFVQPGETLSEFGDRSDQEIQPVDRVAELVHPFDERVDKRPG